MLSENAPAPATFYGSGRIPPQLSTDMVLPSEYNLQFLYTALPHTGDQTMPEKSFSPMASIVSSRFTFPYSLQGDTGPGLDGLPPGIS